MLLQVDMSSEKPIYEQIKDAVIEAILKAEVVEGELLPSSRMLAGSLGVNMHTVGKAYNLLKQGGFVTVLRNKGVMVNGSDKYAADDAYRKSLQEALKGIINEARCRGLGESQMNDVIKSLYE